MAKTKFKNCLFDACKIPIEVFRIPTDGRKWKAAAGNRKTLMMQLAGYANADGTSIRPSTKTLADQTGFSRRKVCRLLDDLKVLGLCERVGRYGQRGAAIRRLMLPEKPSSIPPETPSLRVSDSISESAGFDSQSARFDSESATLDSQSATAMAHDLPSDLPNRPVNQINPIERLTEGFIKATGRVMGVGKKDHPAYAELINQHGEDLVISSVKLFANGNHDWSLVNNPSKLFLSKSSEYLLLAKDKVAVSATGLPAGYRLSTVDPFDMPVDPDALTPEQIEAKRYEI
jgi:hypothetical protein